MSVYIHHVDFAEALKRVTPSIARDGYRPILESVWMTGDKDGFRMATADNYRITIAEVPTPDPEELEGNIDGPQDVAGFGTVAVRKVGLAAMRWISQKGAGTLRLTRVREGAVDRLRIDSYGSWQTVTIPLVDGPIPGYAEIVPDPSKAKAIVSLNPKYVADALRVLPKHGATVRFIIGEPLSPVMVEYGTNDRGDRSSDYTRTIIMPVRTVS